MTEQLNMFGVMNAEDLLPPERQKLRRALRIGSGFGGGKERIRKKADTNPSIKEFAEFLRYEYGVGGRSFEDGFMASTSMHFIICREWMNRKEYSWIDVAKEIMDMIRTSQY